MCSVGGLRSELKIFTCQGCSPAQGSSGCSLLKKLSDEEISRDRRYLLSEADILLRIEWHTRKPCGLGELRIELRVHAQTS